MSKFSADRSSYEIVFNRKILGLGAIKKYKAKDKIEMRLVIPKLWILAGIVPYSLCCSQFKHWFSRSYGRNLDAWMFSDRRARGIFQLVTLFSFGTTLVYIFSQTSFFHLLHVRGLFGLKFMSYVCSLFSACVFVVTSSL